MWKKNMKRLFRLRKILSRRDREQLMNEHDVMSMMYLKNAVQPGELLTYRRSNVSNTGGGGSGDRWLGVALVENEEDVRRVDDWMRRFQLGKMIVGTTNDHLFDNTSFESNVDVVLFKSYTDDQTFLEFCAFVQQLEDEVQSYDYVMVLDKEMLRNGHVECDALEQTLGHLPEHIVLPHQVVQLENERLYTSKNRRHYRLANGRAVYVMTFDPSFDLDSRSTKSYIVRSSIKFVRVKSSFVCRMNVFKTLNISDYYYDKEESIFLSILQAEKALFLTSPQTFYVEELSMALVSNGRRNVPQGRP